MIRLLEFNTACFPGLAPLKAEPLLHFVLSAALHLQLDVIVLVEMFDRPTADYVVRHTPGWDWVARRRHAAGLLIGVRGRIRRATPLDLHERAGCCQFDCLAHKGILHCSAFLERHQRTVDVIGVHLQSCDRLCPGTRLRQLRHLQRYLRRLCHSGSSQDTCSMILTGDFNIPRFNGSHICPIFRRLCRTLRCHPSTLRSRPLRYNDMTWSFAEHQRSTPEHQLTTYPFHVGTGPGLLDHTFVYGRGQVETQIVKTPPHLSDHHALLCRCRLPAA